MSKLNGTHKKKTCPNCGKELQVATFARHYNACTNGYKNSKKNSVEYTEDLSCPFCGRENHTKNQYAQHYIRCNKNVNRISCDSFGEYIRNNRKGKTKFNCEDIKKQSDTLLSKYENGYISPILGRKICFEYIHKEHNDVEISKWLNYISNIDVPIDYETINHNTGYKVISKAQKKFNNTVKLLFEHDYIANILLGDNLQTTNVVHHIDKDGSNNSKENLLIFEDSSSHKRYHNSKYAKLVYNQETHLFSTYIDKA